jgi:hypothetical protein
LTLVALSSKCRQRIHALVLSVISGFGDLAKLVGSGVSRVTIGYWSP